MHGKAPVEGVADACVEGAVGALEEVTEPSVSHPGIILQAVKPMEMIDTYLDAPGKIRLKKQEAGRVPIGEIAGHQMRSQPIEVKLAALLAAKAAGVGAIMFTRDNFSKYPKRRTTSRP